MPSVKCLKLRSYLTRDFSVISKYVDLNKFLIGETKSTAVDISFIQEFKNLEILSIDGMKKGLDSIINNKGLYSLNLRGVKLKNLNFISELRNLRLLKLMYGSYEDLDSLSNLADLEYLGISRTRKISNYDFLKKLKNLQFLHFEGLSQMECLPDFAGQKQLQKIQIDTLNKLKNIRSIRQLKQLKEFLFIYSSKVNIDIRNSLLKQAFEMIKELPELEMTNLLEQYKGEEKKELEKKGIKPWDYHKTRWNQNLEGGWKLG